MSLTIYVNFTISGALIEYALILFKKQKVNKYGIPSQSGITIKHIFISGTRPVKMSFL